MVMIFLLFLSKSSYFIFFFQFPRVRGRGWNRGNYPGNNSNGNPANMNPVVRPPEEEWDPEYTPKSRKYYLVSLLSVRVSFIHQWRRLSGYWGLCRQRQFESVHQSVQSGNLVDLSQNQKILHLVALAVQPWLVFVIFSIFAVIRPHNIIYTRTISEYLQYVSDCFIMFLFCPLM